MDDTKIEKVRALVDRARNLVVDARVHRSTDETVLRAIDAPAEAVALLGSGQTMHVAAHGVLQREPTKIAL